MLFCNGYDMTFCTVGVGLEHLPLLAEHCEHAPLGVVGKLEAHAPVRLGIVLVGTDQPYHFIQKLVAPKQVFKKSLKFSNRICPCK